MPNAAKGRQVGERLPGAQHDFFPLMGDKPHLADKAGELLSLIYGDGYGFDLMVGDKNVLCTPRQPVVWQAQHGGRERLPNTHRPAEDIARQGQREVARALFEGCG